jgi:hypothetical protein
MEITKQSHFSFNLENESKLIDKSIPLNNIFLLQKTKKNDILILREPPLSIINVFKNRRNDSLFLSKLIDGTQTNFIILHKFYQIYYSKLVCFNYYAKNIKKIVILNGIF